MRVTYVSIILPGLRLRKKRLWRLIGRIGMPVPIVGDHGGDLAKGIELPGRSDPEVVGTYDVGHKLASPLRAEWESEPRRRELVRRAGQARAFLRQAASGVPRPPVLRT